MLLKWYVVLDFQQSCYSTASWLIEIRLLVRQSIYCANLQLAYCRYLGHGFVNHCLILCLLVAIITACIICHSDYKHNSFVYSLCVHSWVFVQRYLQVLLVLIVIIVEYIWDWWIKYRSLLHIKLQSTLHSDQCHME